MNAPTGGATNTKSAKPMSDGLPKFEMPKMEMSGELGAITDTGVAHARDAYAKAKVASEEANDLLQTTYSTVAKGATAYNLKAFEIARVNTRAAFDYAHELLGVKSPSEFIELSTAHMRKQFDIASAQNKELCAVAQEMATDAAEQIKTGMSKAFKPS